MLSGGAYSTKFQNLEKERLRQLKEREKANRGKAQLFSKQTAQRQKALEEKKRAMAIAEEDRRRKALEDRRESQKQATKRFKSALGRIRATSKGQVQPSLTLTDRATTIDFYLPDKANPKKGPNTSSQTSLNRPSNNQHRERVAFGKEVEIKLKPKNGFHNPSHINGLRQRTPSLDDVLRQVKGERSHSVDGTQYNQGKIHIHQTVPGVVGAPQQHKQLGSFGVPGRSASDPSLSVTASSHNGKHQSTNNQPVYKREDVHTLSSQATHNLHRNASNDSIVFQHVVTSKTSQQIHPPSSKVEEDLHVVSPEMPDSSSSGLPSDSSSDGPDLHDSLDSESGITFTVGDTQLQNKADEPVKRSSNSAVLKTNSDHFNLNTNSLKSDTQDPQIKQHQPIYVYEVDDSSSNDSTEEYKTKPGVRPTPPRHRKHRKHHNGSDDPTEVSTPEPIVTQQHIQSSISAESAELAVEEKPKIVGILKKSGSSSKFSSCNSVEDQSGVTLEGGEHDYCDGRPQTGTKKKVRFLDKVESSSVDVPIKKKSEIGFIDSARIELWKRVLPNGVSTRYLPNSAFTPKMKVSLLSKASASKGISGPPLKPHPPPGPPNGITVHVPIATADESPGTSPSYKQSIPVQSPPNGPPADSTTEKVSANLSLSEESVSITTQESEQPDDSTGSLKLQVNKQIPLDKTPTDDDINQIWDQIRNALQDNQKTSIPPQVFDFRIQPDKLTYDVSTDGHGTMSGTTRKVNSSRPMRCQQNGVHQQGQLLSRRGHSYTATYPVSNRQDYYYSSRTHPNVQTSAVEPELAVKASGNSFGRRTPTALSLEEQQLMLSIEALNQQIKDHIAKPPGMSQFESPKSPDPPEFTPEYYPRPPPSPTPPQRHRSISTHPHNYTHTHGTVSGRSRGYSDLPKTRVHRNPQTVNSQSRTHGRTPAYRQPF